MEDYLTQIATYLLTQTWQIAAFVVVVAVVNLALKNRSAHVRYLLWLIVLAKCLVPPLLTIPLAVLPAEGPVPAPEQRDMVAPESIPTFSAPAPRAQEPKPAAPMVIERPVRLTVRQWFALAWMGGVAVFVLIAVTKASRTQLWLKRQRKLLPAESRAEIADLFCGLGLKKFPKIWLVEGIGQPFVWGLLRGGIYLPANFVKVNSAEHRKGVLGHELSHVLRFDAAVNLLQTIAQAVFWFHPFVWWANKRIRAEREKCCDEMTIARLNAQVRDYSKAIVDTLVIEYESTRPVPSLAIAGPVKNIEERIKTMMKPGKKFYKRPSAAVVLSVAIVALVTIPTALVLTARAAEVEVKSEAKPTKSLHQAAVDGDLEQVKRLIAEGADINSRGERGFTALHVAAKAGQSEVAKFLIAHGADIMARDMYDYTPLHVTGWGKGPGTVAVAEMLIDNGADVNARAKWHETPLTEATSFGRIALAKLLVNKGADPDAACEQGCTPLHHAVNRQDMPELVELLIANGANIQAQDNAGGTPLHWAARFGREKAAELLVAKGADMNAKDSSGGTPLMEAASNGHVALAKLLIEKGANVNARDENDQTALHIAAWRIRNRDIVDLLIAEGADVNAKDKDGDTPADFAFYGPVPYSNKIVKLLVEKGAGISKLEGVYLAAYLGDLSAVKDYLRQGKDVNAANKDGKTLLHIAALADESEILEFLIANGADLNMKDHAGSTALDYAQCHQHFGMAMLLVDKGAIRTVPKGWARRGSRPEDYAMTVDRSDCHSGQACAHIRFTGDITLGFGTLLQAFMADDYRGKRVKMSAWMKTKEAKRAQLWMRLDGVRKTLGFDNMHDRPVRGTTGWNRYEITLDVPQNTVGVCFGALVSGSGEAWVDDFDFSVVGEYIPDANMPTQKQMDAERIEVKRNPQAYPQQPVNLDFEDLRQ